MSTDAQKELGAYFTARRELNAQRDAGVLDNLHHALKTQHLDNVLAERSQLAAFAILSAIKLLSDAQSWRLGHDDVRKLNELLTWDAAGYNAWHEQYFNQNMETTASRLLMAFEGLTVPSIPEPSPAAKEKSRSALYSRIEDPKGAYSPRAGSRNGCDLEEIARAVAPPGTDL